MTQHDTATTARAILDNGGATVCVFPPIHASHRSAGDYLFEAATTGYVVASRRSDERVYPLDQTADRDLLVVGWLAIYAEQHSAILAEPGHYLGAWIREDGALVLDVSEVIVPPALSLHTDSTTYTPAATSGDAERYADGYVAGICRERGEDAAYHLDSGRTVYADGRIAR